MQYDSPVVPIGAVKLTECVGPSKKERRKSEEKAVFKLQQQVLLEFKDKKE
jgi:hypothetical protein